MIMEIIVGVIALAFVVLVIFLILTLQTTRKTLKRTDRVLVDVQKNLEELSERQCGALLATPISSSGRY